MFGEKIIKSNELKNNEYNISILAVIFGGNYLSKNYKITAPSLNIALRTAVQEVYKEYVDYFHIDLEHILSNCEMQTAILHSTNAYGKLIAVAEFDLTRWDYTI